MSLLENKTPEDVPPETVVTCSVCEEKLSLDSKENRVWVRAFGKMCRGCRKEKDGELIESQIDGVETQRAVVTSVMEQHRYNALGIAKWYLEQDEMGEDVQ